MNEPRERFVKEINVLKRARDKTKSIKAKSDLGKAIKRMEKELRDYDRLYRR